MLKVRVSKLSVTLCILFVSPAFSKAQPSFVGLGDLPGGQYNSSSTAISPDGSIVVGVGSTSQSSEWSFRWTRSTGMMPLEVVPGSWDHTAAYAVSADGSTIAGNGRMEVPLGDPAYYGQAFRWTQTSGVVGLGELPGGATQSQARDISWNGEKIVGWSNSTASGQGSEAFIWTAEKGMVGIGGLGDAPGAPLVNSDAQGISADGSVVVGSSVGPSGDQEAYRWTEATGMVGIGALWNVNFHSQASDVSADGNTIVGYSVAADSSARLVPFRWTEETGMMDLGSFPGGVRDGRASAVSGNGLTVGGWSGYGSILDPHYAEAFIWDQGHGMRNLRNVLINDFGLNLTGWWLSSVSAISYDGMTITGNGTNPNGKGEAWIAVIPEPPTLCMLVLAGFAIHRRPLSSRVGCTQPTFLAL